ncbi:MAG: hypothetical protein BAJALOKI3v1_980008 [Promethearchaeota archaeon]|nr:MAG: hypothetical protein BAJALOKI3v1_980008 [Candidatus Lokiarchaeota archaeon]
MIETNILLVILSWKNCIKLPISGSYQHHSIENIKTDIVIFFGGKECSISTVNGYLHSLFGLGYYYTKFEIQSQNYITDNRELTGLVLSDFVYDHLSTSNSVAFQEDADVIFTDLVVKVPLNLSYKSDTKRTFIKGTLMRNLFIPYKDIFLEMMNHIRKPDTYQIKKDGPMILNADWNIFNTILISKRMQERKKKEFINPTAGITQIEVGVEEYLQKIFSPSEILEIEEKVEDLKKIFASIELDPTYLFSLIENSSKYLPIPPINSEEYQKSSPYKKSILISAGTRLNEYKAWPLKLEAHTEKGSTSKVKVKFEDKNKFNFQIEEDSNQNSNMESYSTPKKGDFILRSMRPNIVKEKKLPESSMNTIDEILDYLIKVINEDYDMPTIGRAFENAHQKLRKIVLYVDYMWEMSKLTNIYKKKNPNLGLSEKEKENLLRKVYDWKSKTKNSQIKVGPK